MVEQPFRDDKACNESRILSIEKTEEGEEGEGEFSYRLIAFNMKRVINIKGVRSIINSV